MANHHNCLRNAVDQPHGHERIHAKHPNLHGAVCRVHSIGGPLVTRDVALVTCMMCLKRLASAAEPVHSLGQIAAQMHTARATAVPASRTRVHARCQRFGSFGRSLCGLRSALCVPLAETPDEITCRSCKRQLRMTESAQREVAHG
jgi:hypothetical protein